MGVAPGSLALGIVIGMCGGFFAGRTESSPDAIAAVDEGRSLAVEKHFDEIAARLGGIESALAASPAIVREPVSSTAGKPNDIEAATARLQSLIDRLAVKTGESPTRATLETILERESIPPDWMEIKKLWTPEVR